MATLVACGWSHAPGHSQRPVMARTEFPVVTGETCGSWCDVRGPEGRVRMTDLDVSGLGRRTATRFKMSYGNTIADCRGPVTNTAWPFVCGISAVGEPASKWLEVRPGCLSGRITRTPGQASSDALELRTDVVNVAGNHAPAREIALLRGSEVLVHSDMPGGRLDFFAPHGAKLDSDVVVALTAYHAFVQLEGLPENCLN